MGGDRDQASPTKASWMSRGSEIPRHGWGTAGLWGSGLRSGQPGGSWGAGDLPNNWC